MSSYSDGRRVEYAVIDHLRDNGYSHMRGASSKGFADVVAIKKGQVLVVNVKRSRMPGPDERQRVLDVVACIPTVGVPLVALKPLRGRLQFRRLTGPGPRDWTPWTCEEAA